MKNNIYLSVCFLFTIILMSHCSCKKSDTPATPTTTGNSQGTLWVHLHTDIDTNEVELGDTARNSDGRKMVLTMAQMYVSGINMVNTNGTSVSVPANILKTVDSEAYQVGPIATGGYSYITFNVGLDQTTNATNPSSYSAGSPLAAHTPPMWFGSTSQGYIFVNVSGYIDTSAGKNGKANYPFSYKIGSNSLLQSVKMPAHTPIFSVTSGGITFVHLIIDYGKIVKGLNLKTENMTDTYTTNPSLAAKVAANIPGMFTYEE